MTPKIVDCPSMSTIGRSCVTIKAVCVHFHSSDNRETLFDAEISCLHKDAEFHNDVSDDKKMWCDEKSGCVHVHVSDNWETLCDTENFLLSSDVDNRKTLCCVTTKAVCVHVHVSDNRGTLFDAKNSRLLVHADNEETLCDEKSG